jgi:hypothetical protein
MVTGTGRIQDLMDQPLVLVILEAEAGTTPAELREFRSLWPEGTPVGWPQPDQRAYLFSQEEITALQYEVSKNFIVGTVSYHRPEVWEGRTDFVMRKTEGEWRVVEFHMPVRGVRTVLTSEGVWRATVRNR